MRLESKVNLRLKTVHKRKVREWIRKVFLTMGNILTLSFVQTYKDELMRMELPGRQSPVGITGVKRNIFL